MSIVTSSVTAAESLPVDLDEQINRHTIEAALRQAIADNVAILATVQAGQNMVDQIASDAATLATLNVNNIGVAKAAINGIGTNLNRVATIQGATITAVATSLQQLTKLARLMLSELEGTD